MANTTLVSSPVRDVSAISTAFDATARCTVRSSRKQTPFSSKRETNVSGLESYRKSLEMEGSSSNILVQSSLYFSQEDRVLMHVINRAGISELVGVLGKLIHFVHL